MRTALKRLLPAAALCLLCACTPQLSAPTGATPSPAAPSPTGEMEGSKVAVYTDWSQLGERERPEPVAPAGTRRIAVSWFPGRITAP